MGIFKRVLDSMSKKQEKTAPLPARGGSTHLAPVGGHAESAVLADVAQTAGEITGVASSSAPSVIFQPSPGPDQENPIFGADVVEASETAFDAACSSGRGSDGAPEEPDSKPVDAAVQDLLAQITAEYVEPLKHFMFELRRGTATTDAIAPCRSVLNSVRGAVEVMNLSD